MNAFAEGIVTIALGIIGLAVVATLVSKKAQTPAVLQSVFSGFGNTLGVAESPVTGAAIGYTLSYPNSSGYASGFGS